MISITVMEIYRKTISFFKSTASEVYSSGKNERIQKNSAHYLHYFFHCFSKLPSSFKAHVKVSIQKIYKALRKNIKGATSPEVQLSLLFH